MYIILSQRKDIDLSYSDDLYSVYHFPARYKSQIKVGDIFVYYQGDRYNREHRVYFGTGCVNKIYTVDGESYYAELIKCQSFENEVPIYLNDDQGYIEQFGYETVRKSQTPPWQSSIRPLSEAAYKYILSKAGKLTNVVVRNDIERLKLDLKNAIKGYYLEDDINCLNDVIDIASKILGRNQTQALDGKNDVLEIVTVQSLIDYCRSMKMSYSYKPVLILSLLSSKTFSISLQEAVEFFKEFYEERRRNKQKIEKKNCIYQSPHVSDEMIADNILANPVKALLKSGYFSYDPKNQKFGIVESISIKITTEDVELIKSICNQKLQAYFSSLGK